MKQILRKFSDPDDSLSEHFMFNVVPSAALHSGKAGVEAKLVNCSGRICEETTNPRHQHTLWCLLERFHDLKYQNIRG